MYDYIEYLPLEMRETMDQIEQGFPNYAFCYGNERIEQFLRNMLTQEVPLGGDHFADFTREDHLDWKADVKSYLESGHNDICIIEFKV